VRIHATTVSSADARIRALRLPRGFGLLGRPAFGFRRPRQPILGTEFAGTIAAIGTRVSAWQIGDAVIGFPGVAMGSHAEHRLVPPKLPLIAKPAGLSFTEASALCFGGTTALHFLRRANLQPGEHVLVVGAAGAVGCALVQLARHQGAKVTAVVGPLNVEFARSLGAETIINYRREDFTRGPARYDVIAETVGATTFRRCLPVLREHGRFLAIAADLPAMFARPVGTKRSLAGPATERLEDVRELGRLAAAGVLRPVIDQIFPFDRLPDAHARVDSGHKRGSAVVQIVPD
jgi:NADPH:quinone reductase-like Zn-dependent oxidoreductase